MGSSSSQAPAAPNVAKTSEKAVSAQVNNLPAILKAQQEYGGQMTEADLSVLEQYAPRMQSLIKSIQEPSVASGEKMINDYLSQPDVLSEAEQTQARADLRASTSTRGLGESGMAAIEELRGLTALRQQLKTQQLNVAMQMAGRGATGLQTTSALQSIMPGQLVQNVNPSQIFDMTQNNYKTQLEQYNKNSSGSLAGALGGGLGGWAIGAALAPATGGLSLAIPAATAAAGAYAGYSGQ
jgi:hypothetical protein